MRPFRMPDILADYVEQSLAVKSMLWEKQAENIRRAAQIVVTVFQNGGKLLLCGNGGSAADAQHIAAEFLIRYKGGYDRPSLPAISLAADSSAITAGGNDFGFDSIFSRQIAGLARLGDALIAITTSGNSQNIRNALQEARKKGIKTVLLTGEDGGSILREEPALVDCFICVPSKEVSLVQECHIMIGHMFCMTVDKELFGKP